MPSNVAEVSATVQRILTNGYNEVSITKDGDWAIRHGSARAFVQVLGRGEGDSGFTQVNVWSIVLSEVKPSLELFKYVAIDAQQYVWGAAYAFEDDGDITIGLRIRLLGEGLTDDQLTRAVGGILGAADDLDDEMKAKFGGRRYYEEA